MENINEPSIPVFGVFIPKEKGQLPTKPVIEQRTWINVDERVYKLDRLLRKQGRQFMWTCSQEGIRCRLFLNDQCFY
jgi:hypothetical protein